MKHAPVILGMLCMAAGLAYADDAARAIDGAIAEAIVRGGAGYAPHPPSPPETSPAALREPPPLSDSTCESLRAQLARSSAAAPHGTGHSLVMPDGQSLTDAASRQEREELEHTVQARCRS